MPISAIEIPFAVDVHVAEDTLSVDLSEGRTISAPLGWFPHLEQATEQEKKN